MIDNKQKESVLKSSISMKFHDRHEHEFEGMDSIDTHYSVSKYQTPETPRKKNKLEEENIPTSFKRQNVESVASAAGQLFSPVTDITHRIKRLRVRIAAPSERDRRRNKIGSTPLTQQQLIHENVPTFAKPTATSLQRKQANSPVYRLNTVDPQAKTSSSSYKYSKPGAIFQNLSNSMKSSPQALKSSVAAAATQETVKAERRLPSSGSVFDRLYEQSTMSRSNSSINVKIPRSKTSHNLSSSEQSQMTRSKTHHDLHGSLATGDSKMTKSTTFQNLSSNRPQWRLSLIHI